MEGGEGGVPRPTEDEEALEAFEGIGRDVVLDSWEDKDEKMIEDSTKFFCASDIECDSITLPASLGECF